MSTTSRSFLVPSAQPITDGDCISAYHSLQHRDAWVVQMLAEHQMLSTPQLVDLGFAVDAAAAEKRLSLLVRRGWLNRFGPGITKHWYSPDTIWCIGPYGAYCTALDNEPVSPARVYRDTFRLVTNPGLSHLRAINQFFVDLAAYARSHPPTTDLQTWWSPRICSRTIASPRYKAWHGVYARDRRRVPFWLEADDGYIRPATLAGHVHRYQPFAARSGIGNVLFLADHADRESELRRHLSHLNVVGLHVATSHRGLGSPATDVWLPLTGGPRRALHQLPEHDLESGPDDLLPDLPERHLLAEPPVDAVINHPGLVVPHPIYDPERPDVDAVADGEYAYTPPGPALDRDEQTHLFSRTCLGPAGPTCSGPTGSRPRPHRGEEPAGSGWGRMVLPDGGVGPGGVGLLGPELVAENTHPTAQVRHLPPPETRDLPSTT